MNKRQLTILIAVLGTIIIAGWAIFFFFMKKPQEQIALPTTIPTTQQEPSSQPTPLQNTPQAQFVKLTDDQVADPVAGAQNVSYFDIKDQLIKVMSLALGANQETKLSQTVFENIVDARWAPNRQAILLVGEQYDQRTFFSIDVTQNLQYDLPDFMENPVWSPDSKQLAFYHWNASAHEAYIATVKADGTGEKKIIAPGLGDNVRILWPTQDTLIFYEKPMPLMPLTALFTYSLKTKQLNALTLPTGESSTYGFEAIASPDGNTLLGQFTTQTGNALSTYSIKGTQMTEIPFQTLVQKCAWTPDSQSVYCAFPKTWNIGSSMLPFDYWRGIISNNDSFARINITTGEFTTFAEATPYDAINMSVSPDETFLTFVNRNDLSLYKMRIK